MHVPPPAASLLLNFRQRFGLSQLAVGAALDVSAPTISDWESGRRRPDAFHRVAMARWTTVEGRVCVPEDAWFSPDELRELDAVRGFGS
jgi:transcriptional regulator with XRE-family HTH domain